MTVQAEVGHRPIHALGPVPPGALALFARRVSGRRGTLRRVGAGAVGEVRLPRDELSFLACARHLAWGYVDQPPLVPVMAWLATHLLGTSPTEAAAARRATGREPQRPACCAT